jgi:hypothetical protein
LTLDLGQANPLPLETSRPGVFAVGDVRSGSIKRVPSAVREVAMAVQLIYERLQSSPRACSWLRARDQLSREAEDAPGPGRDMHIESGVDITEVQSAELTDAS